MARIRSFDELVTNIIEDLRSIQPDLDTKPGTVPRDLIDVFMARLSESYESISQTSRLQSIFSVAGSDLDNLASNYGITRLGAVTSTGTALLCAGSLDFDIAITINNTITAANGSTFSPTGNYTMKAANKSVYQATATRYRSELNYAGIKDAYAIEVPLESKNNGMAGNISAYALRRTDISGISSVTNVSAFSGATDGETDDQLRRRVILSLSGNNIGTKDGIESLMRTNENVVDVYVAVPGDPLMARDGTISGTDSNGDAIVLIEGTGGKVDVYIYGTVSDTYTDTFIYKDVTGGGVTDSGNDRILGTGGSTIFTESLNRRRLSAFATGGTIPKQPVVSILSVSGSESGGNFVEEYIDDIGITKGNYKLLQDSSIGQGGSVFGADKLHFISSEIEISEESASKGTYNGQDALTYSDVSQIENVYEDVIIINEASTVESSRNIIRTRHTPIKTVNKVFNLTTGERYVITDQNVNNTGTYNTTGRIQISGSSLPSATDVLQVNYIWHRAYDPHLDFDNITSLLSTECYNNLVQDSVDWGFSNIVKEESLSISIGMGGQKNIYAHYNVSRIISVKQGTTEIYDVSDSSGAGFSGNIITLPTSSTATGLADIEYIADLSDIISQMSLSQLPVQKLDSAFNKGTGVQPITVSDSIQTSSVEYDGSALPQDNINAWSLYTFSGITAPTITNTTSGVRDVLRFAVASTAGFYFRNEEILTSDADVEFSVTMSITDASIGSSWNSDTGFYLDDGTYHIRFVFFTDSYGTRKIGIRNSAAAYSYSADASVDFTAFHTYKIVKDGTTDVRLYIDDVLAITALYNITNFIPETYDNTIGFGYLGNASPAQTDWDSVSYSITSVSSVQNPLRCAPTKLKCTLNNIPSSGVLYLQGTSMTKVEKTVVATSDSNLTVDLSNWTGLSAANLANVNYKIGKLELLQKVDSYGNVLVDFDITGSVPDLTREYSFSVLPTSETNPWTSKFYDSDEVSVSVVNSQLTMETDATSSTGPSIYFRTETHFASSNIMKATFRMKITDSTNQAISGTTLFSTGVKVFIKNSEVVVPLTFLEATGGIKYVAIEKDTTKTALYSSAIATYPIDWSEFHKYEFEVDKTGNVSVKIDDGGYAISIPYIKDQLAPVTSISSYNISNEAIIFGHSDNRETTSVWDYFNYYSQDTEDDKYKLYDNFYDLHLAGENTSLARFSTMLPNTATNSANYIVIGDKIKVILYYVIENDYENIKFTTDGTQYSNKVFALVNRVSISSGFTTNSGAVTGSILIASSSQPTAGSSYFVDYNYTAPKSGERITTQYTYNKLIGDLTSSMESLRPVTADILIKEAEAITIDVTVDIVPQTGLNLAYVSLKQSVQNSIIQLLTSNDMGTTVDSEDIIDVSYNNVGVDKATVVKFNTGGLLGVRSSISADGTSYLAPGTIVVNLKDRNGNILA